MHEQHECKWIAASVESVLVLCGGRCVMRATSSGGTSNNTVHGFRTKATTNPNENNKNERPTETINKIVNSQQKKKKNMNLINRFGRLSVDSDHTAANDWMRIPMVMMDWPSFSVFYLSLFATTVDIWHVRISERARTSLLHFVFLFFASSVLFYLNVGCVRYGATWLLSSNA